MWRLEEEVQRLPFSETGSVPELEAHQCRLVGQCSQMPLVSSSSSMLGLQVSHHAQLSAPHAQSHDTVLHKGLSNKSQVIICPQKGIISESVIENVFYSSLSCSVAQINCCSLTLVGR